MSVAPAQNQDDDRAKSGAATGTGWTDATGAGRAGPWMKLSVNGADVSKVKMLELPFSAMAPALVRGTVAVLETQLPYVTLLLRVRGNTDVERAALARRRSFDKLVASLVEEAERDGDVRADVDPKVTARLLFGMINSIVEWYRSDSRTPTPVPPADAVCAIAFDGLRVRK